MTPTTDGEFRGTERFRVVRRLRSGGIGVVYEVHDQQRDAHVALKTLLHMDATALYRFKQEFRSLAEIVHPNLVPLYELISDGGQWFFTMELIDGTDLLSYVRGFGNPAATGGTTLSVAAARAGSECLADGKSTDRSTREATAAPGGSALFAEHTTLPAGAAGVQVPRQRDEEAPPALPELDRLRHAFRQVAEGTCALHQAGKLHRDIKPANVLVRPDGRVVLLDFGLVYPLTLAPHAEAGVDGSDPRRANLWADLSDQGTVAGTVAYMSPEQAAAASLTPASDWYAVGVMLYQALTGRLPFSGNRLEVLRAKQERDGPAPADLLPGIPEDLNELCTRLLRRDPGSRPGGSEVLAVLAGGAAATAAGPPPAELPPFVGREKHLAELRRVFDQVLNGRTAVCHVHGRSGAGKSALVQHFLDGVTGRREAVILTGRCYEQESVPYKAVDSLVDALTRFLLQLDRAEVAALLPPDVAALRRIFPVLTRIEAVAEASRGEAEISDLRQLRARAFGALRELLTRIAARRPLIAWVDDLQWGDADGAALLSHVLHPPGAPRLLLLLTYRSEHIGVSPCLRALQIPTGDEDAPVQATVVVQALTPEETLELARVLLDRAGLPTQVQAEWVVRESGGSAFFVHELVRHLRSGLATAQVDGADLDKIIWARALGLPPEGRRLLEVVAVASRPVRLRDAQQAAGCGSLPPQVIALLRSGHLVRTTGPHLDDEIETYHDRVRESVVAHLGWEARQATHTGLATVLEAAGDADPETLAAHFEAAGRPAEASRYYTVGAAKAVGLLAFERAEELYKRAAALAPTDQDRAAAYEQMVHFYTNMGRFAEAYAVGRQGAALVGLKLPAKFRLPAFLIDYARSRLRLRRRRVSDLLHLPDMADPRREAAVRIISAMLKAAYQVQPELNVALSTKGINLCLKHGNTPHCAICYMAYGAIFQGGVLGRHEVGHEFGQLSLNLLEKYGNTDQRGEVNFCVGYFATSWMRPATEAEAIWRVAHQAASTARCGGYEGAADLFNVGNSSIGTIMSYHMRGAPMDEVLRESDRFLEVLRRGNLREHSGVIVSVRQFIRNLRGQTRGRTTFSDAEFDEGEFVTRLAAFGCRHYAHFYYILKAQALYLWGEYDAALEAARASAGYLADSRGMLHWAEHHFHHALVLAALHPRLGLLRRWSCLRTVRRAQRMYHDWAGRCPHNFLHKERLLAAEVFRLRGRHAEALRAYDEAVAAADKYGYLQVQALANERAARLHRELGDRPAARSYLSAACAYYRRWGARAYADCLQAALEADAQTGHSLPASPRQSRGR